jgi:hypothetical protein
MPPLAAIHGLRDMGLFDGIMGKNSKKDDMVLEPRDGGYVLKNHRARAPDISKVCVFFSSAAPLEEEPELLKSLIKEFHVGDRLAPDALITTAYGAIPGIDEYLRTREVPESLNAFIMSRAMLSGLARGPAEMGRLAVDPFDMKGVKGVLVLKEA